MAINFGNTLSDLMYQLFYKAKRHNYNLPVTFGDSPSIDAFNRLRVSGTITEFDSKQIFDNQPLYWDDQEVSGSGTSSTHSTDTASSIMGVSLNTAGKRVRQTYQRFNYQSGKSQLIFMTGTLRKSGGGTGVISRLGYFDDNNGIYFKDDEGTIKVGIRSSTSGSPVDTEVAQSNWNLDTLDGSNGESNPSGILLDDTKSFIFVADFEWLGTGRVRVGLVKDGIIRYVHQFLHSNVLSGVYMSTPNLPCRYEIENDGTGAASTMEHICATVITEGGDNNLGTLRHADSGAVSGLSSGTTYAVLGIRLKSAYIGETVLLETLSMISTTVNDQLHWDLLFNPTVAGTFTYTGQTNSAIEVAIGASTNTITGGTPLDGGYLSTSLPATAAVPNALHLGAAIDGTVDEIVLAAKPITNNITVEGSITWRELA